MKIDKRKILKRELFILLGIIFFSGLIAGISNLYPPMPEEVNITDNYSSGVVIKYGTKSYELSEFRNVLDARNKILTIGYITFSLTYPLYWIIRFFFWIFRKMRI